jgi:hypothetical protein
MLHIPKALLDPSTITTKGSYLHIKHELLTMIRAFKNDSHQC